MKQTESTEPACSAAPAPIPIPLAWRQLLVLVVGVLVVAGVVGGRGDGRHQILWGRCYSHCIKRYFLQSDPEASSTEADADWLPKNPIRACQRHQNCRWCLYVCERPEDNFTNSTACLRNCRYTRTRPRSGGRQACTEACGFVGRSSGARGGSCPAPQSLKGFQSACVTSCRRDHDCTRSEEKCCSNQCGTVCTPPYNLHILPPVPTNISFKMLKTGGVLIKWRLEEEEEEEEEQEEDGEEEEGEEEREGEGDGDTPPVPDPGGGSGRSRRGSSSNNRRGSSSSRRRSSSSSRRRGSSSKANQESGAVWDGCPVVFILRWWCPYTSGAVTSVTDRVRTKLQGYPSGIYPGSKCHFMVAAVNLHGSRGFSRVSPYIKKFLTPSQPLHLEQVRTRLHSNQQVDVTIEWMPPVYTDGLSIFKYQVFWSDHLPQASPSLMRFHMHRRQLDADKTTFVLQSLKPGTMYFVQVRAIVRWKGRQKRGELASTYIETYSPLGPHAPNEYEEGGRGGGWRGVGEDSEESGMIQSVQVNQTFYHDTILKATVTWTLKQDYSARKYLIYWRAETCARSDHRKLHRRLETSATSHNERFVLYNLQPQCEYAVRVHPVSRRGKTGVATVTNFVTPPCHLINIRQGEPPVCHSEEPPGEVQGLHSETTSCYTVLRWQPPSSGADDVEAYDVMWGQTEAGVFSLSTIIYTSQPHELSVPANVSRAELGQLTTGGHYSIQVVARSLGGSSPPSILHLTAPHPDRPCQPPGSQASHEPADVSNPSSSHTLTSSGEGVSDVSHGSDVRGNVSRSISVPSRNQTDPGDVSIEFDVIGRRGKGEEREGGVGDGFNAEGVGVGRGQSTSPPPLAMQLKMSVTVPQPLVGRS